MATFYNKATLSYNNTSTDSNTVTGELLEVISATKSTLNEDYKPGDDVTYLISLNNTGTADITGITVTDNLGAYPFGALNLTPLDYTAGSLRYYQNGVLQAAPAVTAGPPLTISGVTVPAGGNALLVYQATVNRFAPLGDEAEITIVGCCGLPILKPNFAAVLAPHFLSYICSGAVIFKSESTFAKAVLVATQSANLACIKSGSSPFTRQLL